MNDSRKTDIEDIDRHEHNFRWFMAFLKLNNIYFLKKVIFEDSKRTKYDLFELINSDYPVWYTYPFDSELNHVIDKRWAIIFNFRPYLGHYWSDECIGHRCDHKRMLEIVQLWKEYLYNNRFDKE